MAQVVDVHMLPVVDKDGNTVRTIPTKGRALQKPVPADLDGDETWLNVVRTETACAKGAVVSGQFHGDARHSGNYMKGGK